MVWDFMASFKWGDLVQSFDKNRIKRAFQGGGLYRKAVALGLLSIALSGCAIMTDGPDHAYSRQVQQPQTLPSAVLSRHEDHLSHATMERLLHQSITYHLGAGDVISVSVYLHPDLSIPSPMTSTTGLAGAIVTNDGNIQLPLLGVVHVAGMTTTQLQTHLTRLYAQYVIDPKVSVQLQVAHSIRYYLLGEFIKPGLVYSDRPLNVLEAMALGGSVNLAQADLRGAYVVQDGRKLPVNFHKLILAGDLQQNIPLLTGKIDQPAVGPELRLMLTAVQSQYLPAANTQYHIRIHNALGVYKALAKSGVISVVRGTGAGADAAKTSYLVTISANSTDPFVARRLTNALMQTYLNQTRSWSTDQAAATYDYLSRQLDKIRTALSNADARLASFQSKSGVIAVSAGAKEMIGQLADYETLRSQAKITLYGLQQVQKTLAQPGATLNPYLFSSKDPVMNGLATRLAEAQSKLIALQKRYTAAAPQVVQVQADIASSCFSRRNI